MRSTSAHFIGVLPGHISSDGPPDQSPNVQPASIKFFDGYAMPSAWMPKQADYGPGGIFDPALFNIRVGGKRQLACGPKKKGFYTMDEYLARDLSAQGPDPEKSTNPLEEVDLPSTGRFSRR